MLSSRKHLLHFLVLRKIFPSGSSKVSFESGSYVPQAGGGGLCQWSRGLVHLFLEAKLLEQVNLHFWIIYNTHC